MGGLWRSRRWRFLLNLIDHLPQNTWYHDMVSQDIEHAMMMLRAQDAAKRRGESVVERKGPSLRTWSPEVDRLTRIIEELKMLQSLTVAVGSGSKPKKVKPEPRPQTAMETARLRLRNERHAILRARMLPHLYGETAGTDE